MELHALLMDRCVTCVEGRHCHDFTQEITNIVWVCELESSPPLSAS